jgi:two-component system sensor histidine kinase UhpB
LLDDHTVTIEVSDNGAGFAEVKFGRGLTGMHERVRALSGTFEVLREAGRSVVRCRLPVVEPATQARP